MPYSASAFGVLPPLWSRAAKNPRPDPTFSNWIVFTLPHSGTTYRAGPNGMTRAVSTGGDGRPPGRKTAGHQDVHGFQRQRQRAQPGVRRRAQALTPAVTESAG